MIDLKNYPNEVSLLHLYPIATKKGYNLQHVFPAIYDDFYKMLSKISSRKFKENLLAEKTEIEKQFQSEKRYLCCKWENGTISSEELNNKAVKLNEKYTQKFNKLNELNEIRDELFAELDKVDLSKFQRREPTFNRISHAILVATPGYVVKVETESAGLVKIGTGLSDYITTYNEPTIIYSSNNKELIDKCLRRSKVKESQEINK